MIQPNAPSHLDMHFSMTVRVPTKFLEEYTSGEDFYTDMADRALPKLAWAWWMEDPEVHSVVLSTPADDEAEDDSDEEFEVDDCRAVFAYGTLRRDLPGHEKQQSLLDAHGTVVGEGLIAGKMYSATHFPAVVPDNDAAVVGQIIRFDDLNDKEWQDYLALMDYYEHAPELYHRRKVSVENEDGTHSTAFAYFYSDKSKLSELPQIPSGDWKQYIVSQGVDVQW